MKTLIALLRSKDGLCGLAFLIAVCAIFESTIMHGLEFAQKIGLISTAAADAAEVKHE